MRAGGAPSAPKELGNQPSRKSHSSPPHSSLRHWIAATLTLHSEEMDELDGSVDDLWRLRDAGRLEIGVHVNEVRATVCPSDMPAVLTRACACAFAIALDSRENSGRDLARSAPRDSGRRPPLPQPSCW